MGYVGIIHAVAEDKTTGKVVSTAKLPVDLRCALCGRPTRSHEYKGLTYCHRCWVAKKPSENPEKPASNTV